MSMTRLIIAYSVLAALAGPLRLFAQTDRRHRRRPRQQPPAHNRHMPLCRARRASPGRR